MVLEPGAVGAKRCAASLPPRPVLMALIATSASDGLTTPSLLMSSQASGFCHGLPLSMLRDSRSSCPSLRLGRDGRFFRPNIKIPRKYDASRSPAAVGRREHRSHIERGPVGPPIVTANDFFISPPSDGKANPAAA